MTDFDPSFNSPHQIPSCPFPSIVFPLIYVISHNGLSGLSFDGGSYEVKNNKIFENWLWGLMIKSKSSTYLLNNDIFENKCGGIRVGMVQ
jgi:parallel beta-helix repeat protein